MIQVSKATSCKQLFKDLSILPLPCIYLFETIVYMKANLNTFSTNSDIHSYDTRHKNNVVINRCNTSLCQQYMDHMGTHMYNCLPLYLREIPALSSFKKALFKFLLDHCFYTVNEYFENTKN